MIQTQKLSWPFPNRNDKKYLNEYEFGFWASLLVGNVVYSPLHPHSEPSHEGLYSYLHSKTLYHASSPSGLTLRFHYRVNLMLYTETSVAVMTSYIDFLHIAVFNCNYLHLWLEDIACTKPACKMWRHENPLHHRDTVQPERTLKLNLPCTQNSHPSLNSSAHIPLWCSQRLSPFVHIDGPHK